MTDPLRAVVNSPLTLGNVIEVPPLTLVIQLADVDTPGSAAARETLETFVVTTEIEAHMRALVNALNASHGVGCFVKGHYGSGKSHFLSFLALLLHDDPRIRASARTRIPSNIHPPDRSFFQVRVALQRHSADVALEDIVGQAAEEALARHLGRHEVLSDARFLVDNFNSLLLDRHPTFLERLDFDRPTWDAICARQLSLAARHVVEFLETLPNNPLRARADRDHWLDRLSALLPPQTGIVILLDELSEFLKARPNARAFNNDLRWLQFVGERTASHPLGS